MMYEVDRMGNYVAAAHEVFDAEDTQGMDFLEGVELIKHLELLVTAVDDEIGTGSISVNYNLRNVDGESWELIYEFMDGQDEEAGDFPYESAYRFVFRTKEPGLQAYHEWLEMEVI